MEIYEPDTSFEYDKITLAKQPQSLPVRRPGHSSERHFRVSYAVVFRGPSQEMSVVVGLLATWQTRQPISAKELHFLTQDNFETVLLNHRELVA